MTIYKCGDQSWLNKQNYDSSNCEHTRYQRPSWRKRAKESGEFGRLRPEGPKIGAGMGRQRGGGLEVAASSFPPAKGFGETL